MGILSPSPRDILSRTRIIVPVRFRSLLARDRRCFLRTLVLLVYVTALAALPVLHHDVACHIKTPTHCTTCLVGAAEKAPDHSALLGAQLVPLGASPGHAQVWGTPAPSGDLSGRSPPVLR